MPLEGSQTENNLKKLFTTYSRNLAQYGLFAEEARREGNEYIATVFDEAADQVLAHTRLIYKNILGRVKSSEENLRYSSLGTEYNLNKLLEYEQIAIEEGLEDIADFYKELRVVINLHNRLFSGLYTRMSNGTLYKRDTVEIWQCLNCGYLHEGKEAPMVCPLDKYPQGWYKLLCPDF